MRKKVMIVAIFMVTISSRLIFASPISGASLVVHNEDYNNNFVEGVTVELYKDDKLINSGISNSFGDVVFDNLSKGNYEVKITNIPEQYQDFNSENQVEIRNDRQSYELNEELLKTNYGRIQIHQTSVNGSPIVGNEIIIYDQDGKIVDTLITDENGDAMSNPLPEGTYYVKDSNESAYMIYVGGGIKKFKYIINFDQGNKSNSDGTSDQSKSRSINSTASKDNQQSKDVSGNENSILLDSNGKEIQSTKNFSVGSNKQLISGENLIKYIIGILCIVTICLLLIKSVLILEGKNAKKNINNR